MREREHRFGFNLWTGGPTISQLPKKKITKKIPGGQIRPSVQCPTEDCKIKPACRHVAGHSRYKCSQCKDNIERYVGDRF